MKTEELRTVRICCQVTPSILNQIDRLAKTKGKSHQQIVSDLITAQLDGMLLAPRQNIDLDRLHRCRAILFEMEQEINRTIHSVNFRNGKP